MLSEAGQRLIAVVLLLICPSALLLAERPTAMLYANGAVKLNGVPVAKSTTVFDGDRIDTADASVVSINRNGSALLVDPNSSVQYQSDAYTVLKGVARMHTTTGTTTHIGSISVIPKDKNARYDVGTDGNVILVASREGALTLTDGVDSATLEPGYSARVTFADEDGPNPAATTRGGQQQSPKSASSTQYQDQGPKPAAGTRGEQNKRKRKTIFYIFLGSALAAAAVVCAFECGNIAGAAAISPVVP